MRLLPVKKESYLCHLGEVWLEDVYLKKIETKRFLKIEI